MALTVRTNTASGNALNQLNTTSRALARSFERISSGKRISRAADDAAGLGIADNLRADARSAIVAARNTQDGMSMIAVAESASGTVSNLLSRARELAVQAASDTIGTTERGYIQEEVDSLVAEIERISVVTEFNGRLLVNGDSSAVGVQVGIQGTADDQISMDLGDLRATTLGIDGLVTGGADAFASATAAAAALSIIDAAITDVNSVRSAFGSTENRLSAALENLGAFEVATTASESRIRDADFGYESALLSQNQILQQAGVSVLGQANTINQSALSLLQ